MENEFIIHKARETFASQIISVEESFDMLTLVVDKNCIEAFVLYLKDELGFSFLTDLCGIHYPDNELQLGVIYHLHNLVQNKRIRIKAFMPIEQPAINSITSVFSGANWMERETYDFFGIVFENHPNMKRILNVDYLDYFPLRKEYPLEDPTRTDKNDEFFGR